MAKLDTPRAAMGQETGRSGWIQPFGMGFENQKRKDPEHGNASI